MRKNGFHFNPLLKDNLNKMVVLGKSCLIFASAACFFSIGLASSPGKAPWKQMNDGRKIPTLGLGTWLGFGGIFGDQKSNEVQAAVEWAIDAGYRHIDTASIYNTEQQVGEGVKKKIKDGVVSRDDVFITTKLWNDGHARDAVVPTLRASLENLGLEYVDLYLIHWPIGQFSNGSFDTTDHLETWNGMKEAQKLGLAKSIGVSNFNMKQLNNLISKTDVKPAVLQVEINLNLQQPELLAFCKEQNIVVTGYTPFGSLFPNKSTKDTPAPKADDPEMLEMAKKYNKTVAQIALRYLLDLDVVPIPKSVKKQRVEQNINVFDFNLDDVDKSTLRAYDKNYHTIAPTMWAGSPEYPFDKTQ